MFEAFLKFKQEIFREFSYSSEKKKKNIEVRAHDAPYCLACENIRFSSLFAARDVSRGGTSATQRRKFHTDDVKSVRNPVRSADWWTE